MFSWVIPDFLLKANYSKGRDLLYIPSPKCACSTVKRTLLEIEKEHGLALPETFTSAQIHGAQNPLKMRSQQAAPDFSQSTHVFSVVRNPYTRVLSAYLDKVVGDDGNVTRFLDERLGTQSSKLSFPEFLRRIQDVEPKWLESHFRPSTLNLGIGSVRYDFIGKTETMDQFFGCVVSRYSSTLTQMVTRAPHSTKALDKLNAYYDAESMRIVESIYADDFDAFNYPKGNFNNLTGGPVDLTRINAKLGDRYFGFANKKACHGLFEACHLIRKGQRKKAASGLRKLVRTMPELAAGHALLGYAHKLAGQIDDALTHAERAVTLEPDNPDFLTQWAQLLIQQDKLQKAERLMRKAVRIRPDKPPIRAAFAELFLAKGEFNKARRHMRKVIDFATHKHLFLERLSRIHEAAGDLNKAVRCMERVIKQDGSPTNQKRLDALKHRLQS